MSSALTPVIMLGFMSKASYRTRRPISLIATAATVLFASVSTLFSSPAGAWNSTDIAIGSHPIAQSFFLAHDVDASGNTLTVFQIASPNGTEATDVEPGSGVTDLVSGGLFDGVITKFSSSGNLQWAYQMKGGSLTISEVEPRGIQTDSSGNVYVLGRFKGSVDFDGSSVDTTGNISSSVDSFTAAKQDGFLLKLNAAGGFEWVKQMVSSTNGTNDINPSSLDVGADGSVYIAGQFSGLTDLNYTAPTAQNDLLLQSGGGFVAKFSSAGNLVWTYEIEASMDNVVVSNDRVLTAGTFCCVPVDFDAGSGTTSLSTGGFIDIYVMELNVNGEFQRVQHIKGGVNGDQMTTPHVRIGSDGSIFVTGYYFGVNPSSSGINFSPPNSSAFRAFVGVIGTGNGFVAKYSPTFVFEWSSMLLPATPATSSPLQRTDIYAVDLTDDGGVVIGGTFNGKVDLDPGTGVDEKTSAPTNGIDYDAFVMKLNSSGSREWVNVLSNTSGKFIRSIVFGSGYITVYGSFGGTLDFDPSASTYNVTASSTSAFIWRVDRTGTSAPTVLPESNNNNGNSNTGSNSGSNTSGNTSTSSSATSGLPSTTEISGFKAVPLIAGGEPVAGQTYEVTADGFQASEDVNAYLQGSSTSIGVSKASASGTAKVSVKIPKNTSGKKTLYLFGKTSRHGVKQTVVVKATITELPATGTQPQFMLLIAVAAIFGGFGVRRLRRVS